MQTVSYQRRHAELRFMSPPFSLTLIGNKEHHIPVDKVLTVVHNATVFVWTVSAGSNPFLSSDIYKEPPLPAASPAVTAGKKKKRVATAKK